MSITFDQYKKDNPTLAGYFRIGHIVLATPPVDILTSRVVNNERLTTLRGRNDLVKKTGQGRWDVTVHWVSLIDEAAENPFQQWEDLRSILAMFKAAPFVEVENGFIRQALSELDPTVSSTRLGFALRQLRVSTHNDIVDGLDVALTMTLFNYFPYTLDFGYLGDKGQPTDADRSPAFKNYIDQWKAINLNSSADSSFDGSPLMNWEDQIPGTTKLRWREYTTIKIGQPVATDAAAQAVAAQSAAVAASSGRSMAGISGTGQYDTLIKAYAAKYGISPAVVKAMISHESGFKPLSINPDFASQKGRVCTAGTSAKQQIQSLLNSAQNDADGGLAYVQQFKKQSGSYPAYGLMQLKFYVAAGLNKSVTPADLLRPETNIALGCQLIANMYKAGMTDDTLYWYFKGPDPKGVKFDADAQKYEADMKNRIAQMSFGAAPVSPVSAPSKPPAAAFVPPVSSGSAPGDSLSAEQKQQIWDMVQDGWSYDHAVNDVAFFYKENQMTLSDSNHNDIANAYNLFPQQFSILFINNIAQIPLASYQYPTYQHIGSTSSKLSIVMSSVGDRDSEEQEPVHLGISTLTSASELLEAQYLQFRNSWRSVRSVHRMQAFYIENQILNMLGIRGLTIDGISTSSLPSMADTMQVEVSGMQYENIFEVSESYKINSVDAQGAAVTQNLIQSGALNSLLPEEAKTINELTSFATGRNNNDSGALVKFFNDLAGNNGTDFSLLSSLPSVNATSAQLTTITNALSGKALSVNCGPATIARMKQVQNGNTLTTGDCFLVLAVTAAGTPPSQTAQALLSAYGESGAIKPAYDVVFNLLASFDATFASNIESLSRSPKFSAQYNANISPTGPGSDPINKGHGAYKDLGLVMTASNGGDNNPGSYFYDHSADYKSAARQSLDSVVQAAAGTSQQLNTPTRPDSYDLTITESLYVGQNANTDSLVKMTNIPGYDMAEAFPTFKLFLMEDSAPGLIQAFDNFYSYASVLDIEIIRFCDKPDLARIQITNVANILQHMLFDNSLEGKYENSLQPFLSSLPSSDDGTVAGQNAAAKLTAGKTFANQVYQVQRPPIGTQIRSLLGYDMRDGAKPNHAPERMPLQYAVLQPGTKIQVRMGYSNNPDLLIPVFTGRVASVEGVEVLTIEAESYLAELCDIPIKDDKPISSQQRGGWQPWHDAGDVISIVEDMLHVDSAKHFGSFKLSSTTPLIYGMTWQNRAGKMIGSFSSNPTNQLTKIGAAMASSYDRSGENILVNHVISHEGNPTQNRGVRSFIDGLLGTNTAGGNGRSLSDESSTWGYYQFDYRIPDKSTKTTWDYIRDVCRRYPEFQVLCKQYGFPYSADATLVVGHPLDWYNARLPLFGDSERFKAAADATAAFQTWWKTSGSGLWDHMLIQIKADLVLPMEYHTATPTTPTEFYTILNNINNATGQFVGTSLEDGKKAPGAIAGAIEYADQLLGGLARAIDSPAENSKVSAARAEVTRIERVWEQYVQSLNPQANDLLKPIRRYHFIDHQSIVHNGMELNNKIYNTIRVNDKTAPINGNIPSHHRRILDVTDLVIDAEHNIDKDHLARAVQQSFMKEEVGKMYRGEIVLRGIPEIEPSDALVLLDASTFIVGIVEVEKVIHSFNQETGYTTIVYPRCATAVNEAASASVGRMMTMVMAQSGSKVWSNVGAGIDVISQQGTKTKVAGAIGAAAGIGTTMAVFALVGSPPAVVMESLIGIVAAGGLLYAAERSETTNMIEVMPVSRWGRPWVGGLEGYQVADFWQNLQSEYRQFVAENIYPLIDTYRYMTGAPYNNLPVQSQ